ncbi:MAG: MarR family transcriptional regulator [Lachnospiraceae bacterium]|nr:MarR family transcriptional regulator [Lachnospiraceae bacterium]MBR3516654.1 MarR family transcriptional regulator [Lachnospiraceae bacterium]MBR6158423.1 MarR family transcriptional regulator [Lachnospiraceae bacterium]
MELEEYGIPKDIFEMMIRYVDEIKELLSSEIWENIFLNCSKNEILIFWLLYLKKEVNMTEIADYIHVPLNTATGMIGRLEKNGLVERTRSAEDKRVVLIRFSEKGSRQFQKLMGELLRYGGKIFSEMTEEEVQLFFKMIEKAKRVLKEDRKKEEPQKKVRKIVIE